MPFIAGLVGLILTVAGASPLVVALVTTAISIIVGIVQAKKAKGKQQERQAITTNLSLGEQPREAVFGRLVTGGTLVQCWNDGQKNDYETMIIKLADHRIHSLESFYIGSEQFNFTADGTQGGFDANLDVYFMDGSGLSDCPPTIRTAAGANWPSTAILKGCAYVIARYKYSDKTWPSGRPQFKWVVKGAFCYDPRRDSTVPGGAGTQRWDNPATWQFSENPVVHDYNYRRGVYNNGHLIVGIGFSAYRCPPEAIIADANICDELVTLKAGGTEPRYRCARAIHADEKFEEVRGDFARTAGGVLVQRHGRLEISAGTAQPIVATITDDDLLSDAPVQFSAFAGEQDKVNTVVAQYIEPLQVWQSTSAPMRRVYADVVADGRPFEEPMDLDCVTSVTQAQRVAEIRRREGRLERTATIPLGPRFANVEAGDVIQWQSNRYLSGGTVQFRIVQDADEPTGRKMLTVKEFSNAIYSWAAANDELTPGQSLPPGYTAPPALTLSGFAVAPVQIGVTGAASPAVRVSWTPINDPAVRRILLNVRKIGSADSAVVTIEDADRLAAGSAIITEGIPPLAEMEIRGRCGSSDYSRNCPWTEWLDATTGDNDATKLGGVPSATIINSLNAAVSDGILTPGEKSMLLPQINDLRNSAGTLSARALLLGITTERAAFDNAITALNTYLATLTTAVAWDNLTGNTTVDGPTLSARIQTALETRTVLQAACDREAARNGEWGFIVDKPIEITDGRIPNGLTPDGHIARPVPIAVADQSGIARQIDATLQSVSGYINTNGAVVQTGHVDFPAGRYWSVTANGGFLLTEPVPIDPKQAYVASFKAQGVGSDRKVYGTVAFYDKDGTLITGSASPSGWASYGGFHYFGLLEQVPPGTTTTYYVAFGKGLPAGIPANAVQARVGWLPAYSGTTGENRLGAPMLTPITQYEELASDAVRLGGNVRRETGALLTDAAAVTNLGIAAGFTGQGAMSYKNTALWGVDISGTPTELSDGRVATGLTSGGYLARPVPVAVADQSGIVRLVDPTLRFAANWNNTNGAVVQTGHVDFPAGRYWSVTANGGLLMEKPVSIDPKQAYVASFKAQGVGSDRKVFGLVAFYDKDGTLIRGDASPSGWAAYGNYHYFGLVEQAPPGTTTLYQIRFGAGETAGIPANATAATIGWLPAYSGTAGENRLGAPSISVITQYNQLASDAARLGGNVRRENGVLLTDAAAVTSLGLANGVIGAGTGLYANTLAQLDSAAAASLTAVASNAPVNFGNTTLASATAINASTFTTVKSANVNGVAAGAVYTDGLIYVGAGYDGTFEVTVQAQSGGTEYSIGSGTWLMHDSPPGSGTWVAAAITTDWRVLPVTGNVTFRLKVKSATGTYSVQGALWGATRV